MAQPISEPNLTWGQPTQQELTMTSYVPEPDADAVVLCKTTEMKYVIQGHDIMVQYDVKGRIKILKPEGTKHAILGIEYTVNDDKPGNREEVTEIKGTTFNLMDGNVNKSALNSSMISTHMAIDPSKRIMNVLFPDVMAGSVVEYEYTILSDLYLEIKDWEAQCDIPVVYTKYDLSIPEWFSFYMQPLGKEYNVSRIEQKQVTNCPTYTIQTAAQSFSCLGINFEFEGRNLAPIRSESLVFNPHNTGQRVVIDITAMSLPYQLKKNYAMTWPEIDKFFLDRKDFGKLLNRNPLKKEMKQAGIYQINNIDEKIMATVNLLRQKVKWNGVYNLYGTPSKQVLKNGTGSNSDINFMLISMLNDAGVKAFPVILATRNRDYIDTEHPSVKQFSTTAVVIDNGGNYQVFDGSVENANLNILPASFLVSKARIVGKDILNPWINLEDKGLAKSSYRLNGSIANDGTLTATCVVTHNDRAAEQMRQAIKSQANNNECLNSKFKSSAFNITEYTVDGVDNLGSPVTETIKFNYSTQCKDGIIKLPLLLWQLIDPMPFVYEKRYNPIEFPTKVDETAEISITIPSGWAIYDNPAPVSLSTSDNNIKLSITPSPTENSINVSSQLVINRLNFNRYDYNGIKRLVDIIDQYRPTPFVIKKKN